MKTWTIFYLTLAGHAASAAPLVLYETGWESGPASPAWAVGDVFPQNAWAGAGLALGHQVVANGTPGAIVNGQTVVTPFGNQMHRFTGSPDTSAAFQRLAWVDVRNGFDNRPAGLNLLTGSIDLFVPGVQSTDASLYGLLGYDGLNPDFGVLVDPSTRAVVLWADGGVRAVVSDAFAYNTWLNLSVAANYETGEVQCYVNGLPVPGLSYLANSLVGGSFSDLDLFVQNATGAPTERSVFSDNYRLTLDMVPVPEPGTWALLGTGAMLFLLAARQRAR